MTGSKATEGEVDDVEDEEEKRCWARTGGEFVIGVAPMVAVVASVVFVERTVAAVDCAS